MDSNKTITDYKVGSILELINPSENNKELEIGTKFVITEIMIDSEIIVLKDVKTSKEYRNFFNANFKHKLRLVPKTKYNHSKFNKLLEDL